MSEREDSGDQREVRISKLARLLEAGINPYPERFERTHRLAEARALDVGVAGVRVAGRVMLIRVMGKLTFLTLKDQSGSCQVAIAMESVGEDFYRNVVKKLIDSGDFLGITGTTILTKTGEPTVHAESVSFLGKSLRPLPEKHKGLQDQEACYRQRYLDLLMNSETQARFLFRSRVVRVIRGFLELHGFEEVETPILQNQASGAHARPFLTHHNALDLDVTLRIAPETWLKRLIVGGYDRVFEFARCFRNEGMDPSHLQDFTMLEWYASFWNFADNMAFTQTLIQHTLRTCLGTTSVDIGGVTVEFGGEWPRVSFRDLLLADAGIDLHEVTDQPSLLAAIRARGIEIPDVDLRKLGYGNLLDQLYKKVSRPRVVGPMFLTSHPIDLSPLARRNDARQEISDRFQVVVRGWEIVNAYSELVDPLDQRRRLESQSSLKQGGDEEAMDVDEDYLLAMEYGMPPMSGFGMGIDRFCTLLTNRDNLRDVVLFPLMKPPGR